ncbi:hypothetical protein [Parvicella tangerina]|uniref:Uncharacterized protein n=1 Tax=Parvicella tangerina TaxID=2829795 RepID=A0A916JJV5_9FLAO|nr:hypothetical protein [Parvicella tangerina]CAG5076721.1 hypothetical protein CRYO30217_00181 [Parvicella tangerina]
MSLLTPKYAFWISLVLILGLFSLVYLDLTEQEIAATYLNTDTLYQPSLYVDLIEHGNELSAWHLNPSPNFFPDMPIYFVLMLLTGGSILWSTFLFSLIQLVLIELLLWKIISFFDPRRSFLFMTLGNLLLSLFALTSLWGNDSLFSFYLLSNSYHIGSFVFTLLGISLILSLSKSPSIVKWSLLILVILLGYPSDRLLLVSLIVPGVLTSLYLILRKPALRKFGTQLSIVLIVSYGIGWLLLEWLTNSGLLFIEEPHSFLNFENIIPSFKELLRQYAGYLTALSFTSVIFVLSFIAYFFYLIYLFKKRNTPQFWGTLLLFTMINAVLFAPVLAGNYTGPDTIRYNYHAYLTLVFMLPYLIVHTIGASVKLHRLSWTSNGLLLVLMLTSVIKVLEQPMIYFNYYPQVAKNVDYLHENYQVNCGTGGYWEAKVATIFSKHGVLVVPTFDALLPYDHATSTHLFSKHPSEGSEPLFEFSIIDNDQRKSFIRSFFGEHQTDTLILNGYEFMFHPTYTYEEGSYVILHK